MKIKKNVKESLQYTFWRFQFCRYIVWGSDQPRMYRCLVYYMYFDIDILCDDTGIIQIPCNHYNHYSSFIT